MRIESAKLKRHELSPLSIISKSGDYSQLKKIKS